jgi:hypothetical protein
MPASSKRAEPDPAVQGSRWIEVGHCTDPDARSAGSRAARAAVLADDAKLLVVFCSGAYDLAELLAGIGESASR